VRTLQQNEVKPRFLVHDNDQQFTEAHDTVFQSARIRTIRTPFRSPKANAFAERRVRTVREECLDKRLIFIVFAVGW
jgi:hypothetical protein